jgi:hypothetical protein
MKIYLSQTILGMQSKPLDSSLQVYNNHNKTIRLNKITRILLIMTP